MKKTILLLLLTGLLYGSAGAAPKGNTGQKYVSAQETLKILEKMGLAQGNSVSYIKSSDTGDKEWMTHLFMVQQGDTAMPLITYVNKRDVVVGVLIRDGKLVVPRIPIEEIQPRINLGKFQISQDGRMAYNAGAKEVLYMFTDPDCPYCKPIEEMLPQYSGRYKVVVKHFPLEQLHPGATAKATEKQCLWMSEICDDRTRQIAAKIVEDDMQEGAAIGVDATPFFITEKGNIMRSIPDLKVNRLAPQK